LAQWAARPGAPQSADRLVVARAVDAPVCESDEVQALTRPPSAAELLKLVDKGGRGGKSASSAAGDEFHRWRAS
jgi:hypothetical protein